MHIYIYMIQMCFSSAGPQHGATHSELDTPFLFGCKKLTPNEVVHLCSIASITEQPQITFIDSVCCAALLRHWDTFIELS